MHYEEGLNAIKQENNNSLSLFGSKIFNNEEEISFIGKSISIENYNKINLELLYPSEKEGENEEKLKRAYSKQNDVLFLIKTKENKKLGGFAHESFELGNFAKKDSKAFCLILIN